MTDHPLPTEAEVKGWLKKMSNWGRWGDDDSVGAVNLITSEKRLEAAGLVKTGRTVSLSRMFPKHPGPLNPVPAQHFMQWFDRGGGGAMLDFYGISYRHPSTPSNPEPSTPPDRLRSAQLDAFGSLAQDGTGGKAGSAIGP